MEKSPRFYRPPLPFCDLHFCPSQFVRHFALFSFPRRHALQVPSAFTRPQSRDAPHARLLPRTPPRRPARIPAPPHRRRRRSRCDHGRTWKAVAQTRESSPDALPALADTYADLGRYAEALQLADKLLKLSSQGHPQLLLQVRRRQAEWRNQAAWQTR